MRKRPTLTDESAAEAGLNADQFQNALKVQKSGVKFIFTCSQANLKRLQLGKGVLIQLLNQTCYKPTSDPLTTVRKILDVGFKLDLRAGQPSLPPVVVFELPDFNPAPANRTELQNGPPAGFRTDVILFKSLRVHRVWNTAPFGVAFRSNVFDFYQRMVSAIADESAGRGAKWPAFQSGLKGTIEADTLDLFLTANIPAEGHELSPRDGQLTQDLAAAQDETSAACFYCADEQSLRSGLVEFEMPHPVTQKPTWFTAMCCAHIIAAHAVTNWKHYNFQVGPLVAGSAETYTYIMEKSDAEMLIVDIQKEMPRKSFAVPSDGLAFGVSRHPPAPGEADLWRSRARTEPADANLNQEFMVKAEVELVYALLPDSLPRNRPIGMISAAPHLASYDNTRDMAKKLEQAAEDEVQADLLAEFSFKKLQVSSSEDAMQQ